MVREAVVVVVVRRIFTAFFTPYIYTRDGERYDIMLERERERDA